MKLLLIPALLSLTACATCHEHPAACAVLGAVAIGSIQYTLVHSGGRGHDQPPPAGGSRCVPLYRGCSP